MNKGNLKNVIESKGISMTFIAKKIGISRESLYNKVQGKTEFKASEIVKISSLLSLTNKEREMIFFTTDSELNSPNA